MNNEQFRSLLLGKDSNATSPQDGASQSKESTPATGLGARQRSGMTPRSTGFNHHAEFARQLAERNRAARPQKKHKSFAPRGVKLAAGYVDRAKTREQEEAGDREERIKALEEALKKEEIDQATFNKLRNQIVGGDLSSTHLVKGLDFKLLERIRRGEDVSGDSKAEAGDQEDAAVGGDNSDEFEDEFDQVLQKEVTAVAKEKREKKGEYSTVALAPGKKRTRDQILAELKASRAAAKAKQEENLGGKFRKIGAKQTPGSRIERDSKGREVLIIVDEDGHERRKVRKTQSSGEDGKKSELMMPDENAKPLGMEVPEIYRKQEEPEEEDGDVDIFGEAGSDYDPLAGLGSGSDSDSVSDSDAEGDGEPKPKKPKQDSAAQKMPPPPKPGSINYFKDSRTGLVSQEELKAPSMSDPDIQAAFKKAATLSRIGRDDEDEDEEEKARRERRKRMLESVDRDAEDMDMNFGTSRYEDEEDFDDKKVKLSKWGGPDNEGDGDGGRGEKTKRKRRPKTRKGDGNNAADVLRVMEQRKAAGS